MPHPKRSYNLPGKLVNAFNEGCKKGGYIKETVLAAAILHFMNSGPNERAKMFEWLASFEGGKRK